MIFDLNLNTCLIPSYASMRVLANYSHLIPIIMMALLSILVLIKSKNDLFSKVFLFFIITFSLWLIGDLITWTSSNYFLIYSVWSSLVFLEIVFFVFGLYFVIMLTRKGDIPFYQKLILFILTLPPFFITIFNKSVEGFDHPSCLAFNNIFLDKYKLVLEIFILLIIFICVFIPFFKKSLYGNRKSHVVVLGSMFLFLSVFGVTEYIGSLTSDYRINLYSLFLLPVFVIAIIYAVFNLNIFNIKVVGTYFLVFGFIILMGIQVFFVSGGIDKVLTIITIIFSVGLSFIMFKSLHKEADQLIEITKLNTDLEKLITQRESLVHLVTHKVKGSFTRTKYIFAGMLDGMFGDVNPEMKKIAQMGLESDDNGVKTVDLILNAANLQKGTVKYDLKPINLKDLVQSVLVEKKEAAEKKGLQMEVDMPDDEYKINADVFWLKEVVNNIIENSVRYTKVGSIKVSLEKKDSKILFVVKDTGIGVSEEDKKNLFTEGGRGKESVKVNVDSTGYGLYTVKLVVEAHGGRVWVDSEGSGKGSTFYVELAAI